MPGLKYIVNIRTIGYLSGNFILIGGIPIFADYNEINRTDIWRRNFIL